MGTVEGTANDDIIDSGYLLDPDGDLIDGGTGTGPGGGPNDDIVAGGDGDDSIYSGIGNDVVFGGSGEDRIYGGEGNDILKGEQGDDLIYGGAGDDTLYGGDGDDTLQAGDGNDILYGGAGIDFLDGESDRDILVAGYGDYADGGAGGDDFDVLDLRGLGPYRLENLTPDSNGNGFDGQVVFLDHDGNPTGAIIDFVEIEEFLDDSGNRDPVAVDDSATVEEGSSVIIPVLDNDTDPDGDALTVTSATAMNGTVVINADNTLTYTPNDGYTGADEITYSISDGNGGTDTASVAVTVTEEANSPPDAVDDALVSVIPGQTVVIAVLDNDSDPDGDPIRIVSATALFGTVVINDNGTLSYTPNAGASGPDTITYTITDDISGTDTAIVPIMVRDGTVEGTIGDDLIDGGYLGDPEGDLVDNNDAILPGDTGNDDLIYGYGGNDSIIAGDGNDEVYGGTGNDTMSGNDGDDTLVGGAGNDSIRGGTGDDTVYGGRGDDSLAGNAGNDTVAGGFGDDTIEGGGGDDLIGGGQGDDSILGGSGNDTIWGGGGDDVIDSTNGLPTGPGDFDNPYPPLPVDPFPNDDRDTVFGGYGDDTIRTGDDADLIGAGFGNDSIDAGIDNDTVWAGYGNDTIIGGEGSDTIYGGLGDDVIYGGLGPDVTDDINIPDDDGDLVTNNGMDTISAGQGNDTVYGLDDDDTIYGQSGDDLLYGGVDDDEVWSGIGDDTSYGGQGNDTLIGQAGNDTLFGDEGDDIVYGGVGNDLITGGTGNDTLFGGSDRDIFYGGNGGDSVNGGRGGDDFDILNLSGVDFESITYTSADREDGFVTFADGSVLTFEEIENVVPCFTPGTTIATPRGECLVETLREGDRIITRDNGIQEIRWVGTKEITGRTLQSSAHLKPVLIKAGALGNGLPERDMMVSPNHRLLVANDRTQLYFEESEVLAAAKHLVGTDGVHEVDVMQTTYIHFMFDRHEVVLSNGAWSESFQPGDYSLKGIGNAQRNEIVELFPELASKEGLESYQSARKSLKKHEARLLVR